MRKMMNRIKSEEMRMDKDAIATVANKVTYSGAGGAVFFWNDCKRVCHTLF
jgi:hypothetical protein